MLQPLLINKKHSCSTSSIDIAKANAAAVIANAEGEAKQISLWAEANQRAYKLLCSEIGRESVLRIETLKLVKEGKIKITP